MAVDKETIMGYVDSLVVDFLFYDRKEDEDLPMGAIEEALRHGEITVEEITEKFEGVLRKQLGLLGTKRTGEGLPGCELCGDFPTEIHGRCHPTAPVRIVVEDAETVSVRCYVPECDRFIARLKGARLELQTRKDDGE